MAAGPVLVVDFGAQYAQLIARRVREANVYSGACAAFHAGRRDAGPSDPQAIILFRWSGFGVRARRAAWDKKLFEAGVPVLGICYMASGHGLCAQARMSTRPPLANIKTRDLHRHKSGSLDGSPADQNTWMSHGVAVKTAPEGFGCWHTEGARCRHAGRIPQTVRRAVA